MEQRFVKQKVEGAGDQPTNLSAKNITAEQKCETKSPEQNAGNRTASHQCVCITPPDIFIIFIALLG